MKRSSYGKKGSSYTKEQKLSDICDGIVFVKPVSEFNGIHLIGIYDNEFIEKANKRTKGACKTAEDILRKVKDGILFCNFNATNRMNEASGGVTCRGALCICTQRPKHFLDADNRLSVYFLF